MIDIKNRDSKFSQNRQISPVSQVSPSPASSQSLTTHPPLLSTKLLMDEFGRVVDEKGNIIQIKPETKSTLKININKEKEQRVKELLKTQKIDSSQSSLISSKFFDPNIELVKTKREKMKMRAFNFTEKGSIVSKVEELRKKEEEKSQVSEVENINSTDKISQEKVSESELESFKKLQTNFRPPTQRHHLQLKAEHIVPDVEWWDAYFLPQGKKSFSPYWTKDSVGNWIHNIPSEIKFSDFQSEDADFFMQNKVTHYIQHPVPIKNENIEKVNKINLPIFLTEKEKKKARRLRRLEKEKEKQEQMKLGLIKPPPPKLKFNNFMKILGDQAIQDPSQVERLVRKAYEERHAKMLRDNESRKLTKEQRADKIKRKLDRDSKKEVRACLFKVQNISANKIRFKIDRNAQQLYLTGLCLMTKKNNSDNLPNLVYVEGGPLAIKKFKNVMLKRIDWNFKDEKNSKKGNDEKTEMTEDENMDQEEEDENNLDNYESAPSNQDYKIKPECLLVWEGNLKKRLYEKWKMIALKGENDFKKILSEKGIEHYWNLVNSYKIEDS
jgi:U4/U6 small nuclear ribonucleoprotein PRP3